MRLKTISRYILVLLVCLMCISYNQLKAKAMYNCSLSEVEYRIDKEKDNAIELLSCRVDDMRKLESPIGESNIFGIVTLDSEKYDITKINEDFSFMGKESVTKIIRDYYIIPRAVYKYNKYNYADIRSIDLPKCLEIGDNALKGVENLVIVNIPSCEKIGVNGFLNCRSLKSINTSDEYKQISDGTFENCLKLDNFNNWQNVQSIGDKAFKRTNFTSIELENCKDIGAYAFNNCLNLESIIFSDDYKVVKENTFGGCGKLVDILNTNNIESVERSAFRCTGVKKLELNSCKEVGVEGFFGCRELKTITLPKCEVLKNKAFKDCISLEEVTLTECKEIGEKCFVNNESLKEIDLQNCENLGNGAFKNCKELESINLPKCKEVEGMTFDGCKALKEVNIDACEVISYGAFCGCTSLDTLYLPSCKVIGTDAFKHCDMLKKIIIPANCIVDEETLEVLHTDNIKSHKIEIEYVKEYESTLDDKNEIEEIVKRANTKIDSYEKKFYEEDERTGLILIADEGVLPSGTSMKIERLTPEDIFDEENYNQAMKDLDSDKIHDIENIDLYSINLIDEYGNEVQPNGDVIVLIPVINYFELEDLEVLRITSIDDTYYDSEIIVRNGTKYCGFITNHFSIYCVSDKLSVYDYIRATMPIIMLFFSVSMIGILASVQLSRKKDIDAKRASQKEENNINDSDIKDEN